MRPLQETLTKWRETEANAANLEELRRAVQEKGSTSPCTTACRSICWKAFLLSTDNRNSASWASPLREARRNYAQQREHFLKYINHPEALAEVSIDPLADDPDSPWNTVRQDEQIRAEILQDVQRLPDEANYHDVHVQSMILDILFVYCKQYPSRGGYRQGMHELLAPLVHVIELDSLDVAAINDKTAYDELMLESLDAAYVEHDAYALFSKVMENAQVFYEVTNVPDISIPNDNPPSRRQEQSSAIVERSKFIHEVCLKKVDPELASHLTSVEVLPQIFLIRWIRLLFSREFPFDQFLILWDTIFAVDPSLDLIDLICVAMLIRIRWQLLESDYSVCLQLLLKYPQPEEAHGPHTFVHDALYLRGNLSAAGGSALIAKYTGRAPDAAKSPVTPASPMPNFSSFSSLRQKSFGGRSPLPSPSKFIQQPGGVEAFFQGAAKGAKGVLERGEKLGINQAVRDAMGEIKRNMQTFNENRVLPRSPQRGNISDMGAEDALTAMHRRNLQLANMLNETVTNLKAISTSDMEDKVKSLELIEVAAAKIQFVQIYLEDSSMEMPTITPPTTEDANVEVADVVHGESDDGASITKEQPADKKPAEPDATSPTPIQDAKESAPAELLKTEEATDPLESTSPGVVIKEVTQKDTNQPASFAVRPAAIPTRSTLAQSSFSWMLEPDEPLSIKTSAATSKKAPVQHKKRGHNASREKNAFLFGDVVAESEGSDPLGTDDIFGMQPIAKAKSKQ